MTTPGIVCPDCGGSSFTFDREAETEVPIVRRGSIVVGRPLELVRVPCVVAFCNECEFTQVLERGVAR